MKNKNSDELLALMAGILIGAALLGIGIAIGYHI